MRRIFFSLIIVTSCAAASAQDSSQASASEATSREALLKALVNRDRGEITAMEPSSGEAGGVIIGYSSGAVLHCYGDQQCMEFSGTSNTGVEQLAVSRRGEQEILWVSYPQGALYQCADFTCSRFNWVGTQ